MEEYYREKAATEERERRFWLGEPQERNPGWGILETTPKPGRGVLHPPAGTESDPERFEWWQEYEAFQRDIDGL